MLAVNKVDIQYRVMKFRYDQKRQTKRKKL